MFAKVVEVFRVPELRKKILFTLGVLFVYRLGFHVPLPGVDLMYFVVVREGIRPDFPTALARDVLAALYVLARERSSLGAYRWLWRNRRRINLRLVRQNIRSVPATYFKFTFGTIRN